MIKICFFTGARSDYGPIKRTLMELANDETIELHIVAHGMHLLESFGNTVKEIYRDGFKHIHELSTYSEDEDSKAKDFINIFTKVQTFLQNNSFDAIFIVGDRLEAYAVAQVVHFSGMPLIHAGGGHLTLGAIDDIYRYGITNMAQYHFVTSKVAFNRLKALPNIDTDNVFFTGSPTVDAIFSYMKDPVKIQEHIKKIKSDAYCLMTFHPVTQIDEPIIDIMKASMEFILNKGYDILVTYPNNDTGSELIIDFLKSIENTKGVFILPHLGSDLYYAALDHCKFVIGNSSSGIMEAPYFKKPVLNVGSRQTGREMDVGIKQVSANVDSMVLALDEGFKEGWQSVSCNHLYGEGDSAKEIKNIILRSFNTQENVNKEF